MINLKDKINVFFISLLLFLCSVIINSNILINANISSFVSVLFFISFMRVKLIFYKTGYNKEKSS